MAKVKIQGNASGTGILTVTAPNTSTDRTITLPDATGTLATTADSVGGATGVDFNDNVKAKFGTGDDLEIYHDGSNSYITDAGTGNLYLRASNAVIMQSADGGETLASFHDDNLCRLYYDNSIKLETTATGIAVTGATNSTVMPTFNSVDIVSKGSNANGFYIKLAGGGLICTASFTQGAVNNGPSAGGWYTSTATTWTYPVAFNSNPTVMVSTSGGHYNHIAGKAANTGTTTVSIITLNPTSNGNSQGVNAIAIGQWA